jgi:hypothetical protein
MSPAWMVARWVPLLGEPLARRRARQRRRQLFALGIALAVDAVLFVPTLAHSRNGVVQVGVLVVALAASYSVPLTFFWTWKISKEVAVILAGRGVRMVSRPPLFSRRAYLRWLRREHLDQEDVRAHLLAAEVQPVPKP